MEGHDSFVNSLCLSEDGSRLYSGSGDDTIKLWDTSTDTCIATLQGHTNAVRSLCLSFKTNRLISASYDKTIRVWDTTNLPANVEDNLEEEDEESEEDEVDDHSIHTVTDAHRDWINCLALSDNSDTLYSAGGNSGSGGNKDFTIKEWQLRHTWA
jgi:WD40 repeat protein